MTTRTARTTSSAAPDDPRWVAAVRARVLRWGRRHYVSYPWRESRDPWLTLIAELLLQRTRASQALPAYQLFSERYPAPAALRRAGRRGIRRLTNTTGLHRRGETLLALARHFETHGVPRDVDELRSITGVGAYTAAAWLSLHRGTRAAIVDSNVFRWLGRMTSRPYQRDPRGVRWVNELADRLTPKRVFREFNYAVLDFTMAVCTPRNPSCTSCPLRALCDYPA